VKFLSIAFLLLLANSTFALEVDGCVFEPHFNGCLIMV
jgi:hypothetical protein